MVARRALLLLVAGAALAAPPLRIVSTAPSITEMLYALGLGDRVVGVTTYCRYPADAIKKPKIGEYVKPNIEAIVAQRPDLTIVQENPVQLTQRLEALHLKVLEIDHESIARIFVSIGRIADAAGVPERGAALIHSIEADLNAIRQRTAKLPKTRVMFVIGRTPGALDSLYVVGKSSYLNEVIGIAGGENVFRDASASYPNVSIEEVLARNPEVIVDMGEMSQTVGVTDEQKQAVVKLWGRYPSITAVAKGRTHAVASDIFVVPGPRVVEAAGAFARLLHPEAGF